MHKQIYILIDISVYITKYILTKCLYFRTTLSTIWESLHEKNFQARFKLTSSQTRTVIVSEKFLGGSKVKIGDTYLVVKARFEDGTPCNPKWVKFRIVNSSGTPYVYLRIGSNYNNFLGFSWNSSGNPELGKEPNIRVNWTGIKTIYAVFKRNSNKIPYWQGCVEYVERWYKVDKVRVNVAYTDVYGNYYGSNYNHLMPNEYFSTFIKIKVSHRESSSIEYINKYYWEGNWHDYPPSNGEFMGYKLYQQYVKKHEVKINLKLHTPNWTYLVKSFNVKKGPVLTISG